MIPLYEMGHWHIGRSSGGWRLRHALRHKSNVYDGVPQSIGASARTGRSAISECPKPIAHKLIGKNGLGDSLPKLRTLDLPFSETLRYPSETGIVPRRYIVARKY